MLNKIRNFSIIAHVDHGKSTLADRILEFTGAIPPREFRPQFLDRLEVERERGVTVKLQAVRINFKYDADEVYQLNLIDTPGHVDFNYEVSRSLAACEGVLLVIDASQGIEAQTIANFFLAKENNLVIIPVINKIDLPTADVDKTREEIELILGLDGNSAFPVSAKEGIGIKEVLKAIVERLPPPKVESGSTRCLIFDSHYDSFRGVIAYVRVFAGAVRKGEKILLMVAHRTFEVSEVGFFTPEMMPSNVLESGQVGYVIAGIKDLHDLQVGDTITSLISPATVPLPGYKKVLPMVYCSFYATENEGFEDLRESLEKLALNDSALVYEPETSSILGFGFRCGFLGLFHMEIVQERLEKEYGVGLIATAPTVVYKVTTAKGERIEVKNPADFPDKVAIENIEEPYVKATIITPETFIGVILTLCQERRGLYSSMDYLTEVRVKITYFMPLSEVIFGFFDKLKSSSRGYASLDYEFDSYRESELVKLQILIGGKAVDSLSMIVHKDHAYYKGRQIAEKLRTLIPRHLFEIPIQASIGSRIIARESIKPLRKNVTAKCYGGDITRKRKLLEKQKEGKKRMKNVGNVEIPQEAFLSILEVEK